MTIIIGEMNAETVGRIAGSLLVPALILLYGIPKCHRISFRPNTNRKCVLALMFGLLALTGSYSLGAILNYLSDWGYLRALISLILLITLGLSATALIFAIKGLNEYSKQPGKYNQGKAQAWWAIAISTLLIVSATSGVVIGLKNNSTNKYSNPIAVEPGRMLDFTDYNFRFRAPDHPWVSVKSSSLNKDSKASFMRLSPEAYFIIIPEVLSIAMSSEQLADLGKAHIQAAATSDRVIEETPYAVNHMGGILVETEAQVGSIHAFYVQWFLATNGYAFQLMGYGKAEDRQFIEGELKQMLLHFELIDPERVAASQAPAFTTNFTSPSHFYSVNVTNSAWHEFTDLKQNFPEAEFGGSRGDGCFAVLPVWLGKQQIDMDALANGLLATMNITYPDDDFTHRQAQNEAGRSSLQFDYKRTIDGHLYRYRLKIVHAGEFGYLATAWTLRSEESADEILNDGLNRITFSPPQEPIPGSALTFSSQDYKNQANILNKAGVFYFNSENYEKALPLFRAAIAADNTNTTQIYNLLLTFSRLDRPKEGLDFLESQPKELLANPDFLTFKAYFQSKCSLVDDAITNYANAFAGGYRDEEDFKDYVDLLINERQYEKALSEVNNYLQAGDSLKVRLLKADVYREKQDYDHAVELLKVEHDNAPYNSDVTQQLIETLLDANLPNEALVYSREFLTNNPDSYLPYYLKSRCETNLKWYREAKVSLEAAARLEPSNEDVNDSLNYINNLLGEGDNSKFRDPIEPVFLPPTITSRVINIPGIDYARDYGAYYKQRITALSYETNSGYNITEHALVHVLDAVGVAAFSTYQMQFDPLSEDIFVNEANVLDQSGKVIATTGSSDCYAIDDTQDDEVSQRKILNIPIAGLQPGCDVSLTITRRSASNQEGLPYIDHGFSTKFPTLVSGFYLRGSGIGLKIRSNDGVKRETFSDGIYWSIENPMIASAESMQPPADTYIPTLWITDGSLNWHDLATNYLAEIKDQLQPEDSVKIKATGLVAGITGISNKITVLGRFVQTNCTYKAVEFGRHSNIPHKASETLRNSYGDCKDHALLLQQLLSGAGIPAYLTLISADDCVQTDLPSLDQFDHMIVDVPQGNTERFIDATDKGADLAGGTPVGLAEHPALVLDPSNPRLTKLPPYSKDASSISVQQTATLQGKTDLAVDETLRLTGVHAAYMRSYLLGISRADWQQSLQNDMGMSDAAVFKCQISSLEDSSQPLQIECSFVFKNQFHLTHYGLIGSLRGGLEKDYLSTDTIGSRVTPFEITVPLKITSQIVFDLPKGYHVVEKTAPVQTIDQRFITFQSHNKEEEGRVYHSFELQLLVGRHNAADYSAYQQTMEQVRSLMESEIELQSD